MVSPRVYFAMAQDGLFFSTFGKLHPRFGTPHYATYIQIVIAGLLVLSGTFDQIVSYFFFITVVFIALSVAGLFRIRKRAFDGYHTPLFPLLPLFFLGLTAVVLFFVALQRPVNAVAGVVVVLVGMVRAWNDALANTGGVSFFRVVGFSPRYRSNSRDRVVYQN